MTDLIAFIEGRLAGTVTATGPGTAEFRYADEYLRDPRSTPLSMSAPLGRRTYEIERWLDGLLPDNINVRRRWAAQNDAPSARPIDLLGTPLGLECAGAVQFCRPGREESLHALSGGLEPQSEGQIAAWVRRARQDWSAWEGLGARGQFSLAGAQAKCALHRDGQQWSVPYGDSPTTHILKPGMAKTWPRSSDRKEATLMTEPQQFRTYRTRSGRLLTDADIERIADEVATTDFDVDKATIRVLPGVGSGGPQRGHQVAAGAVAHVVHADEAG